MIKNKFINTIKDLIIKNFNYCERVNIQNIVFYLREQGYKIFNYRGFGYHICYKSLVLDLDHILGLANFSWMEEKECYYNLNYSVERNYLKCLNKKNYIN